MSSRARFAAWPLAAVCALALVATAEASVSEGYFMQAKVTRVNADGTIDFWVTSVRRLPREEPTAIDTESPQLPRVIATLELKSTGASSGVRAPGLRGSRISLHGKCEDLDRATRVPVIQVRLEPGRPWQLASLEPTNRAGASGFRQIAAEVCPSEPEMRSAPDAQTDQLAPGGEG